jgi:hypothetical protein
MLCPGIIVHLYPVLLQRSLMLRLYPLLENFSQQKSYKIADATLFELEKAKQGGM